MFCFKSMKEAGSQVSYLNILGMAKRQDSQTDPKKLDLHNQLLEYVKVNNVDMINMLIREHNELLTKKYPGPYFKSILPIARFNFNRKTSQQTLSALVELGYEINSNPEHFEELLYFTAAGGYPEKLQEILNRINENNPESINNTREGDTCLMFLIKYGNASTTNFVTCFKIIVEAQVDVNIPDYNNCTPILKVAYLYHILAKKTNISKDQQKMMTNLKEVVGIILNYGYVDIDCHKWYEKTAREYIVLNNLYNLKKLPRHKSEKYKTIRSKLFSLVIEEKENVILHLKKVKSYDVDDGENTLLQLACILKLELAIKFFLKKGANPNLTTKRNKDSPLEMAAKRNHYKIFEIFLNWDTTVITEEIYNRFALNKGNKLKEKYFLALLNSRKLNVDFVCKYGNTPLHYAAMFSEHTAVLSILHRGGSLVVKNVHGERPIDCIDPRILSKYADECIESKPSQNIYHKKSVITFDYEFLLKTERKTLENKHLVDIEDVGDELIKTKHGFNSETEVTLAISEFPELMCLLKHPIISSFLYVKWYKIKTCFWIIILFHVWCYANFLYFFYNSPRMGNLDMGVFFWTFIASYLAYVSFILVRVFVTREDLNMYFHCYLECCLILLMFVIIFVPMMDLRKHLSVFGILLAAFSLIFWAGYHPKMSSHVAMLQRVSFNFFKILLCYCVLIMAFGIGFHILLKDDDRFISLNVTEHNMTKEQDERNHFFDDPFGAIFKTFVMMTGEFETNDITFRESTFSSYIVFLLFVFIISLILMNLLQGVAVTDTETIQNVTEIVGHLSTIRFIRFIEMILQISFIPNLIYSSHVNVDHWFLLPNSLNRCKLSIFPNLNGKVRCEPNSSLKNLKLTRGIVKDAMNIIIKRESKYNKLFGDENVPGYDTLKELKIKVEEIAEKQKMFQKKIQESVDTLSHNLRMITDNFEIVTEK